jgi:hypothetical protein
VTRPASGALRTREAVRHTFSFSAAPDGHGKARRMMASDPDFRARPRFRRTITISRPGVGAPSSPGRDFL